MIHVIDVQSRAAMQDLGPFWFTSIWNQSLWGNGQIGITSRQYSTRGNAEGAPAIEVRLRWSCITISA